MSASDDRRRLTSVRAVLAAQALRDPAVRSAAARLGRMVSGEPELASPAAGEIGRETAIRFVEYLTAEGFDAEVMATRMERLKFEAITAGKTCGEALADMETT